MADPVQVEAFLCSLLDQMQTCKSQDVLANICQAISQLDLGNLNVVHQKLNTDAVIATSQRLLDNLDKGWCYIFVCLVKICKSHLPKNIKKQLQNLLNKGMTEMPDVTLNICIRSMVQDLPLCYVMSREKKFKIWQHLTISNHLEREEIDWMKTEILWQMLTMNLNDCQQRNTNIEILVETFMDNLLTVLKSYPNLTPICLDLVTMLLAREVFDEKLSMLARKHGSALLKDDALLVKIVPKLLLLVEHVLVNLYCKEESELVQKKLCVFVAVFVERTYGLQDEASGVLNHFFQTLSSCCNKDRFKKIMVLEVVEEAVHQLKNSPFLNQKCVVLNSNIEGWKKGQATPQEALLVLLRQLKIYMGFETSKRISDLIDIISLKYLALDEPYLSSLKKSLFALRKMLEQAKDIHSHEWFSLWVKHSRDFASKEWTTNNFAEEALALNLELIYLPFTFISKGGDCSVVYTENGREAVVQTLASLLLGAVKTCAKVANEQCRKQITQLYTYLDTLLFSKLWQSAEDIIIHQILCEVIAITNPRLHKCKLMGEVAALEIRLSLKLTELSAGITVPDLILLRSISKAVLWQASYVSEQDDFLCFMSTVNLLLTNIHASHWQFIKNNIHSALENLIKLIILGKLEKVTSNVLSNEKFKLLHCSILSCVYHFDRDIRSVGNELLVFSKQIVVDLDEGSENAAHSVAMQGITAVEASLAHIKNEVHWAPKPLASSISSSAVSVDDSLQTFWTTGIKNSTADREDDLNIFDGDVSVKKRRMTYSDSKTIAQAMKVSVPNSHLNGGSIIDALNLTNRDSKDPLKSLVHTTQRTSNNDQEEAITTMKNLSIGVKRRR